MTALERCDIVNEIRLLASIQHVNVCRYYEAFVDGHYLCIVMEWGSDFENIHTLDHNYHPWYRYAMFVWGLILWKIIPAWFVHLFICV